MSHCEQTRRPRQCIKRCAGLQNGNRAYIVGHLQTHNRDPDLSRWLDGRASLTPKAGDAIFLRAGTVHSMGGGLMVFEIQQNSDVTFRLYDWNHVNPKTGKPRALQVDKAMACVDFSEGPVDRVTPVVETKTPVERERLFDCEHFRLWRLRGESPFTVGAADLPRVLVCVYGAGQVEHVGTTYAVGKGDVFVLPAAIGTCVFRPLGAVNVLEIALPD